MKQREHSGPIISPVQTRDVSADQATGEVLYGPIGPERRTLRALWLIRLRWVAIAGQFAVIPPALSTGWLEPRHLTMYLAVVSTLALFNLTMHFFNTHVSAHSAGALAGQVAVDLGVLGSLLLMTGGVYNPMASITLVHASLCPLIFRGAWGYAVGTLLLVLIAIISWFPHHPPALGVPVIDPIMQGLAHSIVTALIWTLTTWLVASLREGQTVIESLRMTQARQDRLRATGLLAAGFCHELATPLNVLGLRLSRVQAKLPELNPDVVAMRESLDKCESVLQSMIGQTLDSERLKFEDLRPDLLVKEVTSQWSLDARAVDLEIGDGIGQWFLPKLLLAQTLADLLDNAHQAMLAVGADAPVIIRTARKGERLIIAVLDSGPGFPDAIRPHLGEPFVTTKSGGSGLGLYNANNLCVALGGDMIISDREAGGACITLSLLNGQREGKTA